MQSSAPLAQFSGDSLRVQRRAALGCSFFENRFKPFSARRFRFPFGFVSLNFFFQRSDNELAAALVCWRKRAENAHRDFYTYQLRLGHTDSMTKALATSRLDRLALVK